MPLRMNSPRQSLLQPKPPTLPTGRAQQAGGLMCHQGRSGGTAFDGTCVQECKCKIVFSFPE